MTSVNHQERPGNSTDIKDGASTPTGAPAQAGRQLGPVGVLAGELVGEDADAADLGQGVLLAVQQLAGGC